MEPISKESSLSSGLNLRENIVIVKDCLRGVNKISVELSDHIHEESS